MEQEYKDLIDQISLLKKVKPDDHFKRTIQYALSRELSQKRDAFGIFPFMRLGFFLLAIVMVSGSSVVVASQKSKPGDTLYPIKKTTETIHSTFQQQIPFKKEASLKSADVSFENNGTEDSIFDPVQTPAAMPTTDGKKVFSTATPTRTKDVVPTVQVSPTVEITVVTKKEFKVDTSHTIKQVPSPTIPQLHIQSDVIPTVLPKEIKDTVKKILPIPKNK